MSSLLFVNIEDLMLDFAKDNKLHDWIIIVVSEDIVASLKTRTVNYGIQTGIEYESKFDNIEFVPSLMPVSRLMEGIFDGRQDQKKRMQFIEEYTSQLLDANAFTDLCCIADMIINDNTDVMIVTTRTETSMNDFTEVLRDFIIDEFKIVGYHYTELMKLSKYIDDTTKYNSILLSLPFDVPETFTGRNFHTIIDNCILGDIDEVKEHLEVQKSLAANMSAKPGTENNLESIFFNRFTEDLEDKLRELLLKKDEDYLKNICRNKGIRIVPHSTKNLLVDKIMHSIKIDSSRRVDYIQE